MYRTSRSVLAFMVTLSLLGSLVWADKTKMDGDIRKKLRDNPNSAEMVSVIIQTATAPDTKHHGKIKNHGGKVKRNFKMLNAIAADLPLKELDKLSNDPQVTRVSIDGRVRMLMDITTATVGADVARTDFEVDGTGIGVAIIDSGIDLTASDLASRVVATVDFTNSTAIDQYGHGTHVAGIIGGSGQNSLLGTRTFKGIAPNVNLIDVKVLNAGGNGFVSDVISGIQWVIQNKDLYNIKIINLSLGHTPWESYLTDPLTVACQDAVNAGITVVAAAGNFGKNELGQTAYGGITSPGNSPAVITVGAMNTRGTATRSDDTITTYSSRGPTYIDQLAKPDLVAPGNHIASVNTKVSTIEINYPQLVVPGSYYGLLNDPSDYIFLSGTSMAAPVVSGAVALMLQVNPSLTPNMIKAILMFTAERLTGLDAMTQGAGYLNVHGALNLADHIARDLPASGSYWIVPGRFSLQTYDAIQGLNVVWGSNVVWGTNVVWGSSVCYYEQAWASNVVWGNNVVWSSNSTLGLDVVQRESAIWGSNVVWGTATFTEDIVNYNVLNGDPW